MRRLAEATVERTVLHKVARGVGGLERSDLELDLDDRFRTFLRDHVQRVSADDKAASARFTGDGDATKQRLDELLDDPDRIVPVSRELAEMLHLTMTAPAIKPGVLASVIGTFDKPKPQKFVALLKLDESTNFRARTVTKDGKRLVTVTPQSNMLPSLGERLQKAALAVSEEYDAPYRVLVVDRQVEGQALFWTTFLGVEPAITDRERTATLIDALAEATTSIAPELDAGQRVKVQRFLAGVLEGKQLNLEAVTKALPVDDPEVAGRFREIVTEKLDTGDFSLDTDVVSRHSKAVFKGDDELTVRWFRARMDRVRTYRRDETLPEEPEFDTEFRVVLYTDTWKQTQ